MGKNGMQLEDATKNRNGSNQSDIKTNKKGKNENQMRCKSGDGEA